MTEATAVFGVFTALLIASAVELALPFRRPPAPAENRQSTNAALTVATILFNLLLNVGISSLLIWSANRAVGVFNAFYAPLLVEAAITVVIFDFAFYWTHVAMHKSPLLWRFHRIHHLDDMVDASTSFRQHPGEGLFRYASIGAVAIAIGASPAAFAAFRTLSAANAILEHADIKAPMAFARVMSWITSWPHFHKIHHSDDPAETDSNYGNLLTIWDRIFSTLTPVERATSVSYGLGHGKASDAFFGLIISPFRKNSGASIS